MTDIPKAFVVTYDGYSESYGSEIYIYGVYPTRDAAEEALKHDKKYVKKHMHGFADIHEVEIGKGRQEIFLGGYTE